MVKIDSLPHIFLKETIFVPFSCGLAQVGQFYDVIAEGHQELFIGLRILKNTYDFLQFKSRKYKDQPQI